MVLRRPAPVERHPLEPAELPDPRPGAGELLLGVAACAVCRTDLQIAEGDLPARRLPIVPGHQVVGRVAAVGRGRRRTGAPATAPGSRGWPAPTAPAPVPARAARTSARARDVHGLGPRRRLREARDGAGRLRRARCPTGSTTWPRRRSCAAGVIGYRSLRVAGVAARAARLGLYGFGASARAGDPGRRATGAARVRRARARRPSGSGRWRSAPSGPAATTTRRPSRSTPPSPSRRRATSSSPRCARSIAAARSRSTPSTSIASRSSPTTTTSGGSAACAASPTSPARTRRDFLALAAAIPVRDRRSRRTRCATPTSPSSACARGEVAGAAVLRIAA